MLFTYPAGTFMKVAYIYVATALKLNGNLFGEILIKTCEQHPSILVDVIMSKLDGK